MFDLIPLARAWGQVTDRNRQADLIGHGLERHLPEATAPAVAATAIGGHQERLRLRRDVAPSLLPPPAQGRRGTLGGVVINAYTDPPVIGGHIVDPIRNRLAQVRIGEIVRPDLFGCPLRLPFLALVEKIADQCLFLRINGHHRLAPLLERAHLRVDVLELRIATWVGAALAGLPIGLQAIIQGM